MAPTGKTMKKKIWMWVAALTSFSMLFSIGGTYGRLIDWASTELIYIPSSNAAYSSNCLSVNGQQIVLSQWQPEETQRTITISITRPVTENPGETLPEETIPGETIPEETIPEETVPEETIPEETIPEETVPEETIPEETIPEETIPEETIPEETIPEETPPEETPEEDPVDPDEPPEDTPEPIEEVAEEPSTEEPSTEEPSTEEMAAEVTVTLDETTAAHLTYSVAVEEDYIKIVLLRMENAPGLEQIATMTVHIQWFDLHGTLCVDMLPYGGAAPGVVDNTDENQVVTGLDPVSINDTINPENPIACVKLNLQTLADFKLTFTHSGAELNRVRWSLDGESYAMLYDSNQLTISYPYPEGWDGTVFLDFSNALQAGQRPTIAVETTGYSRYEASPHPEPLPQTSGLILKAAGLPHIISLSWGDAVPVLVGLQRLVADEAGNLMYTDDTSLIPSITDSGILLTASQADMHPPSGSYRLLLHWIWNETVVEKQIIYFFINTN